MLIIGNSNIGCFMPPRRLLFTPKGQVEIVWVGPIMARDFVYNRYPAETVRALFREEEEKYNDWKFLSMGVHDIWYLFKNKNKLYDLIMNRYQTILKELNDGKFGWLIFPQQLPQDIPDSKYMLRITKQFNTQLTQLCASENIPVVNLVCELTDHAGKIKYPYRSDDNLHINAEGERLYREQITELTGEEFKIEYENPRSLSIEQIKSIISIFHEETYFTKVIPPSMGLLNMFIYISYLCEIDPPFDIDLRSYNTVEKMCNILFERKQQCTK